MAAKRDGALASGVARPEILAELEVDIEKSAKTSFIHDDTAGF
jgi:hypothetical protein